MVDADNRVTGGTADYDLEDYATSEVYTIEYQERYDPPSINIFKLAIWLGAKVGWCTSKFGDFGYRILYWKVKSFDIIEKRFIMLRRMFYMSGFCHGWRGRHWKIKKKIELN